MNIVNSCFPNGDDVNKLKTSEYGIHGNNQAAIIQGNAAGKIESFTYLELENMTIKLH